MRALERGKFIPGWGARKEQHGSLRILLSSTRFIASLFWLTIAVATLVFVLPYSNRSGTPVFYAFVSLLVVVFLAHRYFPYEGYHPAAFFLLMLGTDALIATMVYMTGGNQSSFSLLFFIVIIFSSAYFELVETLLITAATCAIYFSPLIYETVSFEELKNMAIAVPIYFIIALCGFFVISKAREQEREKHALTYLFDLADTKRRELSTLYAVSLKFASTLDEDQMMSILLENACELVSNDAIAVSLWETPDSLWVRSFRGYKREDISLLVENREDNPLYISASAVLPVILKNVNDDARFESFMKRLGFSSMIVVPLYASSSVIGVLSCCSRQQGAFDDDTARILLTLSSEAALALEKARLYRTTLNDKTKIEAIINSLMDGLLVIDHDAKLVLANPMVTELLGIEPEDYNTPISTLFERSKYPIDFKELSYRDALETALTRGEELKSEITMHTDPKRHYQVFWVPLKDEEEKISGAVILFNDITYFIELDRMKSDFISIVSHELKTPLTSIKGFVRLLSTQREGPITEKQRHYLEIVQRQTESLTALINDLLDLSRIEAGTIEVRRQPVILIEVIKGVVQQLENLAREKGISLILDLPPGLPMVNGDQDRLGQVFMNLIHNGIKFTPTGGRVAITASEKDGECLVKISDNGIGISAEDLPKIFDKFFQVDSSSTRRQSGTGLGLPISKQLIAAHGGDLWATSSVGEGTTFFLTLPFYERKEDIGRKNEKSLKKAASS